MTVVRGKESGSDVSEQRQPEIKEYTPVRAGDHFQVLEPTVQCPSVPTRVVCFGLRDAKPHCSTLHGFLNALQHSQPPKKTEASLFPQSVFSQETQRVPS